MRFLFVGSGFPGGVCFSAGSGIGTYLREITVGLQDRGHECHVIVWQQSTGSEIRGGRFNSLFSSPSVVTEIVEGITVHAVVHAYWPIVERFCPDSRDVYNLRKITKNLMRKHKFDVIEIESEEGIAIGIEKQFPSKTFLSVHTTYSQMLNYKSVQIDRNAKYRLLREKKSLRLARYVVMHSSDHASRLYNEYKFLENIGVVPLGLDIPNVEGYNLSPKNDVPTFIVVGSPDLRKGFDRLRPILETYGEIYGVCKCIIISSCSDSTKQTFNLLPPFSNGVTVKWKHNLSAEELMREYASADVLLHPARYESFGLPLIEAAVIGTPIVVTKVGIASELLGGSLSRFIVDADDFKACADALNDAVNSRSEISAILQERYAVGFTRDAMVSSYLEYLDECGLLMA